MQTRNEVGALLFFDDLLELEREPRIISSHQMSKGYLAKCSLSYNLHLVGVDDVFDDDHQSRLEQSRVCDRVQDCRARLE